MVKRPLHTKMLSCFILLQAITSMMKTTEASVYKSVTLIPKCANNNERCRGSCTNCDGGLKQQRRTYQKKQGVGTYCTSDSDCSSWICRENTCFASETCKSIKHIDGHEFHRKSINLVFVGSGFHDMQSWRDAVVRTFRVFDRFEFFGFENHRYNAFFVDEIGTEGFCHFNCEGYSNLLCCDVQKSRSLSNKCFPTGPLLQTIVIHNEDHYGGGGYRYQNLATTSIHELGPTVAVHELAHSLFEFGDEYESGRFTAQTSANCDVEGCPKWADLDEHMGGGLCQMKGCKNGDYYVGENSFMRVLDAPMGHVNNRFTCCTYLALTKGMPSYCNQYDFGEGLLAYCQKDYQSYGGSGMYYQDGRSIDDLESTGKYIVATHPVTLLLNLLNESFSYVNVSDRKGNGPTIVERRQYYGDYPDLQAVCDTTLSSIMRITLEYDTGKIQTMYFVETESVDVPPETSSSMKEVTDALVKPTILEVVIEAENGLVLDLKVELIQITIWTRIWVWLKENIFMVIGRIVSPDKEDEMIINAE